MNNIIEYKSTNTEIVFCIVDNTSQIKSNWTTELVKNLSDFVLSNIVQKGYTVLQGVNEDALLASTSAYKHAVVLSTGTEYTNGSAFFEAVEDAVTQDYFLQGHIPNRDTGYFELHNQCYIINLETYRSLGMPEIGKFSVYDSHTQVEPICSDSFYNPPQYGPITIFDSNILGAIIRKTTSDYSGYQTLRGEYLDAIEDNDPNFDMFIPKDYKGPLDPKFEKGLPDFTDFQEMFAMYGAELPIKQLAGSAGGPVANQKLTFKEWVLQDPVTRGSANAQQLYAEYEEQFDNPFNPNPTEDQTNSQPAQRTAADLFGDINLPTAKKDKSPNALLSNFNNSLQRFPNTIGGRLFGDLSNAPVQTADIFNDIYQQKEWNNAYADMRGDIVADNLYGTTTDAFNKRGTFDVNTGLMGSEGDRTTGLYMSKEGGGVNNPGFKALPAEAQHNILSNMAYGGAKGEEAYLANRDRVIKRELAKAQEAGETKKERKNRIKNYDHNYLQEYIELFRNKNKNDETAIKDIMSQMGVTENDTLFIGNSNNLSGAKMFPEFKLQQYLASQIDPEAYNAGQPVNVNYKNKAPYYTSDPDEDGRSYDFKTANYYDDDNGYIHLIKSKKQNGGEQTVEVDSRMLAKLIAAGADIEKL